MTTINVANAISKEKAEKFSKKINGKSYMNFKVEICPIGGDFAVNVVTTYEAGVEEIKDMLIFAMYCEMTA
jgi:hypothetical protein